MNGWKLVAIGLAAVVSGCAGTAHVSPHKVPGEYGKKLERTIVFVQGGRVDPQLVELFKSRFVTALATRGVTAQVGIVEEKLALEKPPSLEEQTKAFHASTVLLMGPDGGLVSGQSGHVLSQYYASRIYDVATNKLVWAAFVSWHPGDVGAGSADAMVNEFLAAFEVAGLVGPGPDGPIPTAWRERWQPR